MDFRLEICQVPKADFGAHAPALGRALRSQYVPQRLKPRCQESSCGTAEAVPLSKTGFFNISLLEELLEGVGGLFGLFFEDPVAGVFEDDDGYVGGD